MYTVDALTQLITKTTDINHTGTSRKTSESQVNDGDSRHKKIAVDVRNKVGEDC